MQDTQKKILVWLPSPMGDAVLCTPALRAIRKRFSSSHICFFANSVVHQVLCDGDFNDSWLLQSNNNPFVIAKILKSENFSQAILLKNSFDCALAVFLAGIPSRIGYVRQWRGFLLTDKLYPPKLSLTKFKPFSMLDYYLAVAGRLGTETSNRKLQLSLNPEDIVSLRGKLPEVTSSQCPIVVFVPGGGFGPSKCWPADRYAKTADWLISKYNAAIYISVSPEAAEKKIAQEICKLSNNNPVNLADKNVSIGELKSLFSIADLVVCNDTGPRHIAIAFERKVITLFGPNDPAWTQTGWDRETQLVADVPCAPCAKPVCRKERHLCMENISVEAVCETAAKLFEKNPPYKKQTKQQEFIKISESFVIDSDYKKALDKLGLNSIDVVFSFNGGTDLTKDNLASYRCRRQFRIDSPPTTLFLKRYDSPPVSAQIKNWLCARRKVSTASFDYRCTKQLRQVGIATPKVVCYGQQWGGFFEKRSFCVTEKIPDAEAIEKKLPDCFYKSPTAENLKLRRDFIDHLAVFVKKFHETGFRHRDLYFSHIFYSDTKEFCLIDLARVFKPIILSERYRIKDIAQLYYSAPGKYFSKTDRLRFYHKLAGRRKLFLGDKRFIAKVKSRAKRMAGHDSKHGRSVPFMS